MPKLNSLQDLFEAGIAEIYDAEKQILAAMPKMIARVSHKTLRAVLESHLQDTGEQVDRLEQAIEILNLHPDQRVYTTMRATLREGMDLMDESGPAPVLDAACIAAAHMIKQYEIGAYSLLATTCRLLEFRPEVFSLLSTSEEEARSADGDLLEFTEASIFAEAMGLVRLESD
jgi:ferritin-like metal-binding protein YciE